MLSIVFACSVLVACAGDGSPEDDRRFANQPSTEAAQVTVDPGATAADTPTPVATTVGSERNPLAVRGAPSVIYTLVDGRVTVLDTTSGDILAVIPASDGFQIVDVASSASGNKVAVLESPVALDGANARIEVHRSDGTGAGTWELPWPEAATATPLPGPSAPIGSISWSAGGDSLLVSLAGTTLTSIELDGDPVPIAVPGNVGTIVDAALSPGGNDIAVLDVNSVGNGRIMLIDPVADTPRARQLAPPTADTAGQGSVNEFAWLPDGSGIAYILADELSAGALYRLPIEGGQRTLIASPGRVGPTARITSFALSPQGDSVAYTIGSPNGDGIESTSLWARSLKGSTVLQLPAAANEPVLDMWWTDSGLAWLQGSDAISITQPNGETTNMSLSAQATPAAIASPQASPIAATPVFPSPVSTPIAATPTGATPVASPQP